MSRYYFQLISSICILVISCKNNEHDYSKWEHYGGTKDAARYSSLTQINKTNVNHLKVAWQYHCGDSTLRSQIQCQPIVVNGILYGTTPKISVFAIDAVTGQELWRFNPFKVLGGENSWAGTNRGVTYYEDKNIKRILFCAGNFLLSIDASTGEPDLNFGDHGKVDLQQGLTENPDDKFLIVSNTPGVIFKDKLILGMRLSEGLDAAPGHIRAYNVKTGKQEWIFHTIPVKGEYGYETWDEKYITNIGGANNWAGMSLDEENEMVFVPTGSATYDFYGGFRTGDNLFSNCIIALDANTGIRKWHYQTIHHDVWDRDIPSNPNLLTINKNGKKIKALAQITKHGYVFLLDRFTGKPIYPIHETEINSSKMPDEVLSKTQPIPTFPKPFMRQTFTANEINNLTPQIHEESKKLIAGCDYGDMWLSPNPLKPFILFPGFDGGAEWGGASYDASTNILYVNSNEMPWKIEMIKNEANDINKSNGEKIYINNCANCHGLNRKGNPPSFPSLASLKLDEAKTISIIKNGKGAMPSYKHLSESERRTLIDFLYNKTSTNEKKEMEGYDEKLTSPYVMKGYQRLITKDGYPVINPPWGTLNAINLNTGKIQWKVPLGEFPELTKMGIPITGRENYGGPINTAGGIIFIAATSDEMIRAFDKDTGELLWEHKLPASGHATPAVYEINGKQYIVIACGGGKGSKSGDSYMAFSL